MVVVVVSVVAAVVVMMVPSLRDDMTKESRRTVLDMTEDPSIFEKSEKYHRGTLASADFFGRLTSGPMIFPNLAQNYTLAEPGLIHEYPTVLIGWGGGAIMIGG